MPRTKTLVVEGVESDILLAIAYGSMEKLGWETRYATENILVVSPNDGETEITVEVNANQVMATAARATGESFTLFGNGKKQIQQFLDAVQEIKDAAGDAKITEWQEQIEPIKEKTLRLAEEQRIELEALNKVMNLSSGNTYFTYGLIAINLLVFIAMLIGGVHVFSPTGEDIVKWGGNFSPDTLNGDWWRLFTCMFVHIGIVHLLLNMYSLYIIGSYLEPMLGRLKFMVAYLCTGIFASLASLWWHDTPVASAGASGAIFGTFGVFLALLSTSLIPKRIRGQLLGSISFFVIYNLIYGLKGGVDNAAHIGGLASGIIIGYIYYLQLRRREENIKTNYHPAMIVAATILSTILYLRSNEQPGQLNDSAAVSEKFSRTLEHFSILDELAMEALRSSDTVSKEQFLLNLQKTALVDWTESVNLFEEAKQWNLPPVLETLRDQLRDYSNQRVHHTLLLIRAIEENTEKYKPELDSMETLIFDAMERVRNTEPPKTN